MSQHFTKILWPSWKSEWKENNKKNKITNNVGNQYQILLAPNVYKVEIADKVLHESSPKHSFGVRTNADKPLDTPG